MKKLYSALFAISFFILTSCGASLSDVKEGMTTSEVEELLGSANHKTSSSSSYTADGETVTFERATWKYDGVGTIHFEDGIVVSTDK
ncbi:MAG: hypothetical protein R2780_14435 [Crocinitomicaceae bacterium]|nr:hypothetical protein [Crocinitomicaceae bacterium]